MGLGDLDGEGVGVAPAVGAGFDDRLATGQGFKVTLAQHDGVCMGASAGDRLTTPGRGIYIVPQDGYVVGVARIIGGGDRKTVRAAVARARILRCAVGVIASDLCDEQRHQTHRSGNMNKKLLAFHGFPF